MRYLITLLTLFISTTYCYAAPVLLFSDITSGPKTGIGDGLGSGAIVTVWGTGLGSSHSTSTIKIGSVEAAYVYEWANATQHTGHPADLYTYHKMQTISFSVPSAATDGTNTISVTVSGVDSNTLPFTVRSGNIYHVKTSANGGNNANAGSWEAPWETMSYAVNTGMSTAGSITYVSDGVTSTGDYALVLNGDKDGTSSLPMALIAYPLAGAYVTSNGSSQGGVANANHTNEFWVFSKLDVHGSKPCFSSGREWRVVGSSCTDVDGQCGNLSGQGGAMGEGAAPTGWPDNTTSGIKFLGNYVHDVGCDDASATKMQHTFYISVRSGVQAEYGVELGWNHLADNKNNFGLHFYDEGYCGGWGTANSIHDNVVLNQNGSGMDYNMDCQSGHEVTTDMYMYNNLLVNVGNNYNYADGPTTEAAVVIGKTATAQGDVFFYNNTISGYGETGGSTGAMYFATLFGGTIDYRNNIVVDLYDNPFLEEAFPPTTHTNNLWYDSDGVETVPEWDTAPITTDPLFVTAGSDFALQELSPAVGTGADTSSVVVYDILGATRVFPYDIGAFAYAEGEYVPSTTHAGYTYGSNFYPYSYTAP